MLAYAAGDWIRPMADGTIKQRNPLSGTEVWTVPGRGNRPLGVPVANPQPLDPAQHGQHCAFCEKRYLETPPEKSRLVHSEGWRQLDGIPATELFATTAEFRRIPNLFEILSWDYWHENYGYELPSDVAARRTAYLATDEGKQHVLGVIDAKLRLAGTDPAALTEAERIACASGFFGGGHDVIVGRRHFVDDATHTGQLASSGTLTPQEHGHYIAFTVDAMRSLYAHNRYARYVAVFQNWLKPAGASFDHLHKQLVAIDERAPHTERVLLLLRENPNLFNEVGPNYAAQHNLVLAENPYAIAYAGFGHRYPTVEVWSKSASSNPWEQSDDEIRGMSDLIHAMHAAMGPDVPCNEEWQHRPADVNLPTPWHVNIKWRISTLAGFEGGTRVYLNTISPAGIVERLLPRLVELREAGTIADMQLGREREALPNCLRYAH